MANPFVFSEILPLNSIVNPNTSPKDYLDLQSPFSFFDFLKYTEAELSPLQFNDLYVEYIRKWGIKKNNTQTQINQTIEQRYIELVKEITLKYASIEEKRFLSNVDYTDKTELDILIPFYSQKITEICNFYSEKREKLKYKIQKNKIKGTPSSLEKAVFETITDVVFADTLEVSTYQKLIDEEQLLKDLNIEIEELYDIYTNYLDNDPTKTSDFYDIKTKLKKDLFTANLNSIDANIFINIDQAITNQLFEKVYVFLTEFGKNFTINYNLNQVDLNCKPNDRLFNLVNDNKPKATRLVTLRNQLIRKYIGCDFHYIITGEDTSDITTDVLFKAINPSGNLLNRHFPTTASVEEDSDLQSCRKIGLFFTPEKNSILYFSVPEKKYKINKEKLEPNKLYIFPDPELYGNTFGLSRVYDSEYPLIHVCDYSKSINNRSGSYIHGDIKNTPYTQDFYAYFSRNQLTNKFNYGKDGFKSNFSNLYDKGVVYNWASDIYGNQFALFKPKSKNNHENYTTTQNVTTIVYEDYYGGPITFSTGMLLPEVIVASNPKWVKENIWSSYYYYNTLIEGGIGGIVNGLMERGMYIEGYAIDGLVIDRDNNLGSEVFDIRLNDANAITLQLIEGNKYNNTPPIPLEWDLNPNEGLTLSYTYVVENLFYARNAKNLYPVPNKKTDGITKGNISEFAPHFYYDYVLSSIKYKEYDSGFIMSSDEEEEYLDFNEKTSFIVNQTIEDTKTELEEVTQQITKNSYQIKNSYGSIYIKDIITGDVKELSSTLNEQFRNKYNSFKSELYNKVVDFNIHNDFIWIRTPNYLVFEKLSYQDTGYVYSGTGENYISYALNGSFLTNVSNPFIFENRNYCMTVLLSVGNPNSINFVILPLIYKVDYATGVKTLIKSTKTDEEYTKIFGNDGLINKNKLRRINKPILTYNSRNNKYCILATIEDLNEFAYVYKIFFDFDGLNISNEEAILYDLHSFVIISQQEGVIITDIDTSTLELDEGVTVDPDTGAIEI